MYVQRAGFLDGMPGLILSGLYAYYTCHEVREVLGAHETMNPVYLVHLVCLVYFVSSGANQTNQINETTR